MDDGMNDLETSVDRLAEETGFSGVVRVDLANDVVLDKAYGLANRAYGVANTPETRFATASAVKGLTALTVVSLIDKGALGLDTTARSILGSDLPLIADDVTVEHLLAHRSGIGDYVDEDEDTDVTDFVLKVPFSELVDTEAYLPALDGFPSKFRAGERFSYCNGGYVVLALIAQRVSGVPFGDLVRTRVCEPAGMSDTAFLRSDELPDRCAVGYLAPEGLRTNVFHLPVVGTGDGGIYTTAADVRSFWTALFGGRIVSHDWVTLMTTPRSDVPSEHMRYGLGFWVHPSRDVVLLAGYDAGVSFRSGHDPATALTHTVVANTSDGAWPIARHLLETLTP